MPSTDYIPRNDDAFRTYAENFAGIISANPALYMLTAAQAASIQGVVDTFVAKLAISSNENTRTKNTIADKDDARSVAETMIRQYAVDIKNNEGITDGDKLAIGVRPINPDREPIEPPTTQPPTGRRVPNGRLHSHSAALQKGHPRTNRIKAPLRLHLVS